MFHLMGVILQNLSGAPMVHVPYKGAAPAVTAAETGEVQLLFTATNNVIPLQKSGKLRALAVMGSKPFAGLPGVPPMAQAFPAMTTVPGWFAFFGPAGLPAPIVARLNGEIAKAVNAPDVRGKFEAGALGIIANSAEAFAAQYAQTFDIMATIVKQAGLRPE
jgi:tripartite-type tricarboxylate transporter receptor subunit TctC